jgi:hypothetical protein
LGMRVPRFQFTIRRLIVVIAICGVSFALLRTPALPVVVAIAMVLPGFLIGRARGGSGIIAGALSMSGITMSVGAVLALLAITFRSRPADSIVGMFSYGLLMLYFSFVLGLLVSGILYLVFEIPRRAFARDEPVSSDGIRWLSTTDLRSGVTVRTGRDEPSDGIRWLPPAPD